MDDPHANASDGERGLADALKRARIAQAERSGVIVDLRAAEIARLEALFDEVQKLVMQVPEVHRSLFEGGMVPGFPPRLWVDILAYVEMARDKRTYRFVRESREERAVLAESTELAVMLDRITDYVAHRIVERERAFDEAGMPLAPLLPPARPPKPFAPPRTDLAPPPAVESSAPAAAEPSIAAPDAPARAVSAGSAPPAEPVARRNGEWAVRPPVPRRVALRGFVVTLFSDLMTAGTVIGFVAWLTLGSGR
jgi:hypothetical protein